MSELAHRLFGDFLPASVDGTFCAAHGISANGQVIVGEARYDIVDDERVVQGFRLGAAAGHVERMLLDPLGPREQERFQRPAPEPPV